jgi:hypothetical protein
MKCKYAAVLRVQGGALLVIWMYIYICIQTHIHTRTSSYVLMYML